jgi:hypothetical protein
MGNECSQPNREVMWSENSKTMEADFPILLELRLQHHVPKMRDIELKDLIFAVQGFGPALD